MHFLADLLTNRRRNTSRGRQASLVLGYVEIRLVQRQWFHQIGVPLEDLAHAVRDSSISYEIRREKDSIGAQAFRTNRRHGRPHTKASRFIRSGTDHRTGTPPGDNDRLAAQLRIIPLFDGSIEGVHVDVNDFADVHLATIDSAWVFTRLRIAFRMRAEKGPTKLQSRRNFHKAAEPKHLILVSVESTVLSGESARSSKFHAALAKPEREKPVKSSAVRSIHRSPSRRQNRPATPITSSSSGTSVNTTKPVPLSLCSRFPRTRLRGSHFPLLRLIKNRTSQTSLKSKRRRHP